MCDMEAIGESEAVRNCLSPHAAVAGPMLGRWKADFVESLKDRSPGLYRFLTRDDKPYPLIREIMAVGGILLLMAVLLWGGTGQSLGDAPVVVIESGSMMHCANGLDRHGDACQYEKYGRLGTIDPGDLVFVRDADTRSDVATYAMDGKHRHGMAGDVVVYRPNGDERLTPIIHRAMFWLEIHGNGQYSVPELGLVNITTIQGTPLTDPIYGLPANFLDAFRHGFGPDQSGWITKGDNNSPADQPGRLPVQPEWLLGKARGEVPWIGLIKLKVSDIGVGTQNYNNAPGDVKGMMWLTVIVLVAAPFVVEKAGRRYEAWKAEKP